jgi:hypothetical protein
MAEPPIHIDDVVEIDNALGNVELVGNDSTRIRRVNRVHLLVPNSLLLERTVVNWTLVDKEIHKEHAWVSPTDPRSVPFFLARPERLIPRCARHPCGAPLASVGTLRVPRWTGSCAASSPLRAFLGASSSARKLQFLPVAQIGKLTESLRQVREITCQWIAEHDEERPHDNLARIPPTVYCSYN